uniref:Uncharacterized protein n=1 Tax=Chromera velia CCMP2878 TaxID=1169474 RepID=A0A0G4HHL6_9ALVE|eukprot:Cvel_6899.t1-p1 / transcript=Cvel_6899.t1 / gene=Cvel_6899 / organism=Chromera_velia_CCMP2878 / gene_product=hypothetical protein / transcript_product=hypothetical protein / location=Cvel_scaffold349:6775-24945(-) / protein_length=4500 / sequence_SO=supercontig / SO=protein_coding / is_pseudo=false
MPARTQSLKKIQAVFSLLHQQVGLPSTGIELRIKQDLLGAAANLAQCLFVSEVTRCELPDQTLYWMLSIIRSFLMDSNRDVRAAAFRACRYMLVTPAVLLLCESLSLPHIMCVALEGTSIWERASSLKAIRQWMQVVFETQRAKRGGAGGKAQTAQQKSSRPLSLSVGGADTMVGPPWPPQTPTHQPVADPKDPDAADIISIPRCFVASLVAIADVRSDPFRVCCLETLRDMTFFEEGVALLADMGGLDCLVDALCDPDLPFGASHEGQPVSLRESAAHALVLLFASGRKRKLVSCLSVPWTVHVSRVLAVFTDSSDHDAIVRAGMIGGRPRPPSPPTRAAQRPPAMWQPVADMAAAADAPAGAQGGAVVQAQATERKGRRLTAAEKRLRSARASLEAMAKHIAGLVGLASSSTGMNALVGGLAVPLPSACTSATLDFFKDLLDFAIAVGVAPAAAQEKARYAKDASRWISELETDKRLKEKAEAEKERDEQDAGVLEAGGPPFLFRSRALQREMGPLAFPPQALLRAEVSGSRPSFRRATSASVARSGPRREIEMEMQPQHEHEGLGLGGYGFVFSPEERFQKEGYRRGGDRGLDAEKRGRIYSADASIGPSLGSPATPGSASLAKGLTTVTGFAGGDRDHLIPTPPAYQFSYSRQQSAQEDFPEVNEPIEETGVTTHPQTAPAGGSSDHPAPAIVPPPSRGSQHLLVFHDTTTVGVPRRKRTVSWDIGGSPGSEDGGRGEGDEAEADAGQRGRSREGGSRSFQENSGRAAASSSSSSAAAAFTAAAEEDRRGRGASERVSPPRDGMSGACLIEGGGATAEGEGGRGRFRLRSEESAQEPNRLLSGEAPSSSAAVPRRLGPSDACSTKSYLTVEEFLDVSRLDSGSFLGSGNRRRGRGGEHQGRDFLAGPELSGGGLPDESSRRSAAAKLVLGAGEGEGERGGGVLGGTSGESPSDIQDHPSHAGPPPAFSSRSPALNGTRHGTERPAQSASAAVAALVRGEVPPPGVTGACRGPSWGVRTGAAVSPDMPREQDPGIRGMARNGSRGRIEEGDGVRGRQGEREIQSAGTGSNSMGGLAVTRESSASLPLLHSTEYASEQQRGKMHQQGNWGGGSQGAVVGAVGVGGEQGMRSSVQVGRGLSVHQRGACLSCGRAGSGSGGEGSTCVCGLFCWRTAPSAEIGSVYSALLIRTLLRLGLHTKLTTLCRGIWRGLWEKRVLKRTNPEDAPVAGVGKGKDGVPRGDQELEDLNENGKKAWRVLLLLQHAGGSVLPSHMQPELHSFQLPLGFPNAGLMHHLPPASLVTTREGPQDPGTGTEADSPFALGPSFSRVPRSGLLPALFYADAADAVQKSLQAASNPHLLEGQVGEKLSRAQPSFRLRHPGADMVELMKLSGVLEQSAEPGRWNWNVILMVVSGPLQSVRNLTEKNRRIFLRRIIKFFSPRNSSFFLSLAWTTSNLVVLRACIALFGLLLHHPEGSKLIAPAHFSFFMERRESLLDDLAELLLEECLRAEETRGADAAGFEAASRERERERERGEEGHSGLGASYVNRLISSPSAATPIPSQAAASQTLSGTPEYGLSRPPPTDIDELPPLMSAELFGADHRHLLEFGTPSAVAAMQGFARGAARASSRGGLRRIQTSAVLVPKPAESGPGADGSFAFGPASGDGGAVSGGGAGVFPRSGRERSSSEGPDMQSLLQWQSGGGGVHGKNLLRESDRERMRREKDERDGRGGAFSGQNRSRISSSSSASLDAILKGVGRSPSLYHLARVAKKRAELASYLGRGPSPLKMLAHPRSPLSRPLGSALFQPPYCTPFGVRDETVFPLQTVYVLSGAQTIPANSGGMPGPTDTDPVPNSPTAAAAPEGSRRSLSDFLGGGQYLAREWVALLGVLSSHPSGQELLTSSKIPDLLLRLVEHQRGDPAMAALIPHLSLQSANHRQLIEKVFAKGSPALRIACLRHFRLLFHTTNLLPDKLQRALPQGQQTGGTSAGPDRGSGAGLPTVSSGTMFNSPAGSALNQPGGRELSGAGGVGTPLSTSGVAPGVARGISRAHTHGSRSRLASGDLGAPSPATLWDRNRRGTEGVPGPWGGLSPPYENLPVPSVDGDASGVGGLPSDLRPLPGVALECMGAAAAVSGASVSGGTPSSPSPAPPFSRLQRGSPPSSLQVQQQQQLMQQQSPLSMWGPPGAAASVPARLCEMGGPFAPAAHEPFGAVVFEEKESVNQEPAEVATSVRKWTTETAPAASSFPPKTVPTSDNILPPVDPRSLPPDSPPDSGSRTDTHTPEASFSVWRWALSETVKCGVNLLLSSPVLAAQGVLFENPFALPISTVLAARSDVALWNSCMDVLEHMASAGGAEVAQSLLDVWGDAMQREAAALGMPQGAVWRDPTNRKPWLCRHEWPRSLKAACLQTSKGVLALTEGGWLIREIDSFMRSGAFHYVREVDAEFLQLFFKRSGEGLRAKGQGSKAANREGAVAVGEGTPEEEEEEEDEEGPEKEDHWGAAGPKCRPVCLPRAAFLRGGESVTTDSTLDLCVSCTSCADLVLVSPHTGAATSVAASPDRAPATKGPVVQENQNTPESHCCPPSASRNNAEAVRAFLHENGESVSDFDCFGKYGGIPGAQAVRDARNVAELTGTAKEDEGEVDRGMKQQREKGCSPACLMAQAASSREFSLPASPGSCGSDFLRLELSGRLPWRMIVRIEALPRMGDWVLVKELSLSCSLRFTSPAVMPSARAQSNRGGMHLQPTGPWCIPLPVRLQKQTRDPGFKWHPDHLQRPPTGGRENSNEREREKEGGGMHEDEAARAELCGVPAEVLMSYQDYRVCVGLALGADLLTADGVFSSGASSAFWHVFYPNTGCDERGRQHPRVSISASSVPCDLARRPPHSVIERFSNNPDLGALASTSFCFDMVSGGVLHWIFADEGSASQQVPRGSQASRVQHGQQETGLSTTSLQAFPSGKREEGCEGEGKERLSESQPPSGFSSMPSHSATSSSLSLPRRSTLEGATTVAGAGGRAEWKMIYLLGLSHDVQVTPEPPPPLVAPPHLFAHLAQTTAGVEYLERRGCIATIVSRLKTGGPPPADSGARQETPGGGGVSEAEICSLETRAYIWCLGHLGSSLNGLAALHRSGGLEVLVRTALKASNLGVRGTAAYALGLLLICPLSVEEARKQGWDLVARGPTNLHTFFDVDGGSEDEREEDVGEKGMENPIGGLGHSESVNNQTVSAVSVTISPSAREQMRILREAERAVKENSPASASACNKRCRNLSPRSRLLLRRCDRARLQAHAALLHEEVKELVACRRGAKRVVKSGTGSKGRSRGGRSQQDGEMTREGSVDGDADGSFKGGKGGKGRSAKGGNRSSTRSPRSPSAAAASSSSSSSPRPLPPTPRMPPKVPRWTAAHYPSSSTDLANKLHGRRPVRRSSISGNPLATAAPEERGLPEAPEETIGPSWRRVLTPESVVEEETATAVEGLSACTASAEGSVPSPGKGGRGEAGGWEEDAVVSANQERSTDGSAGTPLPPSQTPAPSTAAAFAEAEAEDEQADSDEEFAEWMRRQAQIVREVKPLSHRRMLPPAAPPSPAAVASPSVLNQPAPSAPIPAASDQGTDRPLSWAANGGGRPVSISEGGGEDEDSDEEFSAWMKRQGPVAVEVKEERRRTSPERPAPSSSSSASAAVPPRSATPVPQSRHETDRKGAPPFPLFPSMGVGNGAGPPHPQSADSAEDEEDSDEELAAWMRSQQQGHAGGGGRKMGTSSRSAEVPRGVSEPAPRLDRDKEGDSVSGREAPFRSFHAVERQSLGHETLPSALGMANANGIQMQDGQAEGLQLGGGGLSGNVWPSEGSGRKSGLTSSLKGAGGLGVSDEESDSDDEFRAWKAKQTGVQDTRRQREGGANDRQGGGRDMQREKCVVGCVFSDTAASSRPLGEVGNGGLGGGSVAANIRAQPVSAIGIEGQGVGGPGEKPLPTLNRPSAARFAASPSPFEDGRRARTSAALPVLSAFQQLQPTSHSPRAHRERLEAHRGGPGGGGGRAQPRNGGEASTVRGMGNGSSGSGFSLSSGPGGKRANAPTIGGGGGRMMSSSTMRRVQSGSGLVLLDVRGRRDANRGDASEKGEEKKETLAGEEIFADFDMPMADEEEESSEYVAPMSTDHSTFLESPPPFTAMRWDENLELPEPVSPSLSSVSGTSSFASSSELSTDDEGPPESTREDTAHPGVCLFRASLFASRGGGVVTETDAHATSTRGLQRAPETVGAVSLSSRTPPSPTASPSNRMDRPPTAPLRWWQRALLRCLRKGAGTLSLPGAPPIASGIRGESRLRMIEAAANERLERETQRRHRRKEREMKRGRRAGGHLRHGRRDMPPERNLHGDSDSDGGDSDTEIARRLNFSSEHAEVLSKIAQLPSAVGGKTSHAWLAKKRQSDPHLFLSVSLWRRVRVLLEGTRAFPLRSRRFVASSLFDATLCASAAVAALDLLEFLALSRTREIEREEMEAVSAQSSRSLPLLGVDVDS